MNARDVNEFKQQKKEKKMKKCCLVGFGAVLALGSVCHAASLKEVCLSNPDKFYWVESAQDCASAHPCEDPNSPHFRFYCNQEFKDIQVASARDAQELADLYVKKRMGLSGGCSFLQIDDATVLGQDYVRCATPKGGFIEFEFDDYSELFGETAEYNYQVGKCIAYGGIVSMADTQDTSLAAASVPVLPGVVVAAGAAVKKAVDRSDISCFGVTENQCNEMYSGLAVYYNPTEKVCVLKR